METREMKAVYSAFDWTETEILAAFPKSEQSRERVKTALGRLRKVILKEFVYPCSLFRESVERIKRIETLKQELLQEQCKFVKESARKARRKYERENKRLEAENADLTGKIQELNLILTDLTKREKDPLPSFPEETQPTAPSPEPSSSLEEKLIIAAITREKDKFKEWKTALPSPDVQRILEECEEEKLFLQTLVDTFHQRLASLTYLLHHYSETGTKLLNSLPRSQESAFQTAKRDLDAALTDFQTFEIPTKLRRNEGLEQENEMLKYRLKSANAKIEGLLEIARIKDKEIAKLKTVD